MKKPAVLLCLLPLVFLLTVCGGNSGSNSGSSTAETRTFLMGTTPFFTTATVFPDWRFENMGDKDLLSMHADDFWGVPWDEFRTSANPTLPAAWVSKWASFISSSRATGKLLYLALSPLGDRKKLAPRVDAAGNSVQNWGPEDANGCYPFATDANAAAYKTAYINYVSYLVNLIQPAYLSPAVEMNMQFARCSAADKAAYIAWYTDVHNAIKTAYPNLIIFPTFQQEYMYGIAEPAAACLGSMSLDDCFSQHLTEALAIPADRIAFSTYPITWKYRPEYSFSYPLDTYTKVKNATQRKIWISETGWTALPVLQSYQHGSTSTCGPELFPASMANDTEHASYLTWLLGQAETNSFEAVIWWLNRDYLDNAVASACPCVGANDTCGLTELFYDFGFATGGDATGDFNEALLRMFGNMALRKHDGTPRPGHATWLKYYNRSLQPGP